MTGETVEKEDPYQDSPFRLRLVEGRRSRRDSELRVVSWEKFSRVSRVAPWKLLIYWIPLLIHTLFKSLDVQNVSFERPLSKPKTDTVPPLKVVRRGTEEETESRVLGTRDGHREWVSGPVLDLFLGDPTPVSVRSVPNVLWRKGG